jgi:hypothetical protein
MMSRLVASEAGRQVPQRNHDYRPRIEGRDKPVHFGYGDAPVHARREHFLDQDLVATSGGASICAWANAGRLHVWLCSSGGAATSIELLPSEVDSLIEMLKLGKEAV